MRPATNLKLNNHTKNENILRTGIKAITLLSLAIPLVSAINAVEIIQNLEQGTVIGKVFNDTNRNGIQDASEYGIPGVRLATVKGLIIETDGYGRYHIPDSVMNERYARNFLLKIDATSLPIGSIIQSENPRVIRLSKSSANKINFAVTY